MKRLADILLIVAALLLLAACTDDADVYNTSAPSEGNLCVYIPVSRGADDALGSLSPTVPTYNATIDECKINDLHLYAFPVDGKGTFLSQELPSPEASNMLKENIASYQLKIKPGKYRVYVVANMNDVLDGQTITTEDNLKNVVLSYVPPTTKPGMPVAENIPMIYEPATKNADGTTTDGTITIKTTDKTATTVVANLRFTCVKVCLNLVYDPNAADAALKANGLRISDIIGNKLSPQTNLLWNGKFSNPSLDASSPYAEGITSTLYDASASASKGAYYSSWTETPSNANINNKDIISVEGKGTAAPADPTQKWLFRATYYLPERYVAEASQQSALKIVGKIGSNIDNSYNINLGHRQDETSTTEIPTFPRSTYYEIVGRLKTLGNIDLDCVVGVKNWEPATIDIDLNHTTLWVSSTSAKVESQKVAFIDYLTNVTNGDIEFGCDTEIEKITAGKLPVIVATNDIANHRVKFSINPDLSVADFRAAKALTGTAKVWIKAGNIKKFLDVSYDVTPYFKVDPVDIVIQYDAENSPELTKVVKFTTNLIGIQFPDGWAVLEEGQNVKYAQSKINIKCDKTDVADGTFTITAVTNPVTTTTHVFTVKAIGDNNIEQQIRVTVRPPVGPYRIYMRAINDLAWTKDASNLNEFQHSNMLDEEEAYNDPNGNNNWRDGWWVQEGADWSKDRSSHVDYHKVYIYTQIGETKADGTKDENTAEWYFTGGWPGRSMEADNNNPGWYYYSIAHNAKSESNNNKGQAQTTAEKMIKPGQTLLIFSNGTYTGTGYQPHRFTHHNDPGITLFNYEDREGWYLYDPLSDPYYRVYDKKPTVVDVEYTIYTKGRKINGWYCQYGVNSSDGKGKFTMWCNTCNFSNEFECTEYGQDSNNKTWYKTILHLKAPLGEYDKNLRVKLEGLDGESNFPILFDGDNYPVSGTVTRTINGRNCVRYVIEGSYDPDTKTWKKGAPFKK